jgi:hypothetical protein
MERNSQSTGFSQHWKARFNIQELKSWLNEPACVRGFFETHYRKRRGARATSRSLSIASSEGNTHVNHL